MPTKIEWATESWNPITGCSPVSEGCENCYARRMANRLKGRFGYPADDPFKVTFHPDKLEQPLHWKKPRMIFVCSMGDLFHHSVKSEWIRSILFQMYAKGKHHTYLILTKRPERMHYYFLSNSPDYWPLPNVWPGISAENQPKFDERVSILLQIPAAKRFVSIEPMLGPVDLSKKRFSWTPNFRGLDWVICGGESGPGARPMHPAWPRSIRDQCQAAGVPFFFKQWGEWIGWDDIPEHKSKIIRQLPQNKMHSWTGKDNPDLSPAGRVSYRIGKKAAGRLLDGWEWNERP